MQTEFEFLDDRKFVMRYEIWIWSWFAVLNFFIIRNSRPRESVNEPVQWTKTLVQQQFHRPLEASRQHLRAQQSFPSWSRLSSPLAVSSSSKKIWPRTAKWGGGNGEKRAQKKASKRIIKFELCPQLCNWPSAILFTLISSSFGRCTLLSLILFWL